MIRTMFAAACVLAVSTAVAQADGCAKPNPAAAFFAGAATGDPGAYWRIVQAKCAAVLMQQEIELRQLQIEAYRQRVRQPARHAPPREIYVSK